MLLGDLEEREQREGKHFLRDVLVAPKGFAAAPEPADQLEGHRPWVEHPVHPLLLTGLCFATSGVLFVQLR